MKEDTYRDRSHLIVYSLLQLTCIVLSFVAVIVPDWFTYCWFKFNIANARNVEISNWDWNDTVYNTYTGFCKVADKLTIESFCPGFCGSVEKISKAGGTLAFFLLYSITLSLCTMFLHVFRYCRPKFRSLIAYFIIPIPSIPFILGLLLYFYLGKFYDIKQVSKSNICTDLSQKDFEVETGIVVLGVAGAIQLLLSFHSFFITRKLFV